MVETPADLLARPSLVTPVAPWCRLYDELELGILMLAQPAITGGRRCAELERQLRRLAEHLPLGAIYFQRVKRAARQLEGDGALAASGAPRSRSYSLTPQGLAGLVLNLQVVQRDPSLDGAELELKRALVSMWSLLHRQIGTPPAAADDGRDLDSFYAEAEAIEVLGQRVLSAEIVAAALDPLQPIRAGRRLVEARLASTRERLSATPERLLERLPVPFSTLGPAAGRALVQEVFGRHELLVAEQRYEHYLRYLQSLAALATAELPAVELGSLRDLLASSRVSDRPAGGRP